MLQNAPDAAAAEHRLNELLRDYPLPEHCVLRETFFQRTLVGKLQLYMSGLIADAPRAAGVTGSAAAREGFPIDRAYFELLERISIMLARDAGAALPARTQAGRAAGTRAVAQVFAKDGAPESVRSSLSNGVALHDSWEKACAAGLCELIERDRVLRSFAGEYAPRPMLGIERKLQQALKPHYQLEAYEFGPRRKRLKYTTSGLFLFPREPSAPLIYGFAAALSPKAALARATSEALQRLAFLWGEELPKAVPIPNPTPDYHQEYYLFPAHHELLRAWLAGRRTQRHAKSEAVFDGASAAFVDLTPEGLRGRLAVAKVLAKTALPLRFGAARGKTAKPPHPIA